MPPLVVVDTVLGYVNPWYCRAGYKAWRREGNQDPVPAVTWLSAVMWTIDVIRVSWYFQKNYSLAL